MNARPQGRDLTGSQSVDRALKLLTLVGRQADNGMPLSEVVAEGGLNKATTRRLLLALMRAGFIEQDPEGRRYFVGEQAYVLGSLATSRFGLREIAMESLLRISRKSEDSSFVSIRRDTHSICLHREEGTFPIRTHALLTGYEHPLGVGAGSLAMLATLPDAEIERVLERNAPILERDFPRLLPDQLRKLVKITRSRGYSINPGLIYANSWGMGIAVKYPDGRLAGALSIAAIDSRMQESRQNELAAMLREEAKRVEDKLAAIFGHRPTGREPAARGRPREDDAAATAAMRRKTR